MASLLNSKPVFMARLTAAGLAHTSNGMASFGVETLGDLAFATTWLPGSADDSSFLLFKKSVLGEAPVDPGDAAGPARVAEFGASNAAYNRDSNRLRRLFVEAYTIHTAELRRQVTTPSGEITEPRKLMIEERNERLKQIKDELNPGLRILPNGLEPSHLLTDKFVAMVDRNEMNLVDWSELTCRAQELNSVKKDPAWLITSDGSKFKFQEGSQDLEADTSTTLELKTSLQRRGVAMQLANLCSFIAHEQIVHLLMEEFNREALRGYARLTLLQVQEADKHILTRLCEASSGALQIGVGGELPLSSLVPGILGEKRLGTILQPLPLHERASSATKSAPGNKRGSPDARLDALEQENKRLKALVNSSKGSKPKGQGKGKDSGKKKEDRYKSPVPKALSGGNPKYEGKNVCFDFNLGKCGNRGDCSRGVHRCMKCGSSEHGMLRCNK